jgi:agmatine deiminase
MKKYSFLFSILYSLSSILIAQETREPWKLGHWLSPEEMHKPLNNKSFVETPPPAGPIRNIAEFDRMQGALVRYPFGIPISVIKEMAKDLEVTTIVATNTQKNTVIGQYVSNGVDTSHCNFLIAPSDSYWTRDYGPWFESDSSNNIGIVDFPYNRPRPNDDEIPKKVAEMLGIPWFGMNIIHTGGNYMTGGLAQSSSTTLVWDENPTQTHAQIAQKVLDYLGVDNYMVVEDPNNTYIDHIDCWGKFLAPDKILIRKVPTTHAQYNAIEATAAYYASQTCPYGYPYKVYRVNTPQNQPYTNSVILNNKVLVPIMNNSWDDSALAAYQVAMPGYQVYGFIGASGTPWESTDALHCRVMGLADIGLLYIKHIPVSGNQPAENDYFLSADLIPCSDSSIYNDSVLIYYKVNDGPFSVVHMTNTGGYHYTGYIPKQPGGSIIKYYLYAADKSGRNATCPFIGPADPFTFYSVYTDLVCLPDTLIFENEDDVLNGKFATIHNYTTVPHDLTYLQDMHFFQGTGTLWMVEPYPSITFPYTLNPGDSLRFRVIITYMTESMLGYAMDSLHFASEIDTSRILIMINDTLIYSKIRENSRNSDQLRISVFPNPALESTTFSFALDEPQQVRIEIADLNGRILRTLSEEITKPGIRNIRWDLRSHQGNRVANGIYFYRLTTEKESISGRIIVN